MWREWEEVQNFLSLKYITEHATFKPSASKWFKKSAGFNATVLYKGQGFRM